MYIKKTLNDNNKYDISIEEDNKLLKIYQNDENINFSCRYSNFQNFTVISFVIKEDQTLYQLFQELYENIKTKDKETKEDPNEYQIVDEKGITIFSDSISSTSPNALRIKKDENKIVLYFIEDSKDKKASEDKKNGHAINIQIKQRKSILGDINIPFYTFFDELQKIQDGKENKLNLKSKQKRA